jgi:hypothetical protein
MSANKAKFRETLWFKKGEIDTVVAHAAAEAAARGQIADLDKADSLPIEDRYCDDGSVTRGDSERYSLRTGWTSMVPAIPGPAQGRAPKQLSERQMVAELKGSRMQLALAILFLVGIAAVVGMQYGLK